MVAGSQVSMPESQGAGGAPHRIDWGKVSLVIILFAVLFAATAVVFSIESSGKAQRVRASALYGPVKVRRANEVITFELVHYSPSESWSYIEGEVLNAEKKTVMSFGGDYYHESGYDGGRWTERQKEQTVIARFPKPGDYYLKFKVETGAKYSKKGVDVTDQTSISVRTIRHIGGSGMLDYIAILLIVVAFGLLLFHHRSKIQVAT